MVKYLNSISISIFSIYDQLGSSLLSDTSQWVVSSRRNDIKAAS